MLNSLETWALTKKRQFIRIDGQVDAMKRGKLVEQFQKSPNCRYALMGITAANTGLTLSSASIVVFAELHWTPGQLIQAEDRCHRLTQKNHVICYYLVGKNTLDTQIYETLIQKAETIGRILDGEKAQSLSMDQGTGSLKQDLIQTKTFDLEASMAPRYLDESQPKPNQIIPEEKESTLAERISKIPQMTPEEPSTPAFQKPLASTQNADIMKADPALKLSEDTAAPVFPANISEPAVSQQLEVPQPLPAAIIPAEISMPPCPPLLDVVELSSASSEVEEPFPPRLQTIAPITTENPPQKLVPVAHMVMTAPTPQPLQSQQPPIAMKQPQPNFAKRSASPKPRVVQVETPDTMALDRIASLIPQYFLSELEQQEIQHSRELLANSSIPNVQDLSTAAGIGEEDGFMSQSLPPRTAEFANFFQSSEDEDFLLPKRNFRDPTGVAFAKKNSEEKAERNSRKSPSKKGKKPGRRPAAFSTNKKLPAPKESSLMAIPEDIKGIEDLSSEREHSRKALSKPLPKVKIAEPSIRLDKRAPNLQFEIEPSNQKLISQNKSGPKLEAKPQPSKPQKVPSGPKLLTKHKPTLRSHKTAPAEPQKEQSISSRESKAKSSSSKSSSISLKRAKLPQQQSHLLGKAKPPTSPPTANPPPQQPQAKPAAPIKPQAQPPKPTGPSTRLQVQTLAQPQDTSKNPQHPSKPPVIQKPLPEVSQYAQKPNATQIAPIPPSKIHDEDDRDDKSAKRVKTRSQVKPSTSPNVSQTAAKQKPTVVENVRPVRAYTARKTRSVVVNEPVEPPKAVFEAKSKIPEVDTCFAEKSVKDNKPDVGGKQNKLDQYFTPVKSVHEKYQKGKSSKEKAAGKVSKEKETGKFFREDGVGKGSKGKALQKALELQAARSSNGSHIKLGKRRPLHLEDPDEVCTADVSKPDFHMFKSPPISKVIAEPIVHASDPKPQVLEQPLQEVVTHTMLELSDLPINIDSSDSQANKSALKAMDHRHKANQKSPTSQKPPLSMLAQSPLQAKRTRATIIQSPSQAVPDETISKCNDLLQKLAMLDMPFSDRIRGSAGDQRMAESLKGKKGDKDAAAGVID